MTPAFLLTSALLTKFKRLWCWLFWHDWSDVREICHRRSMVHLHPLAGCRARCAHCGEEWRDTCADCHEVAR